MALLLLHRAEPTFFRSPTLLPIPTDAPPPPPAPATLVPYADPIDKFCLSVPSDWVLAEGSTNAATSNGAWPGPVSACTLTGARCTGINAAPRQLPSRVAHRKSRWPRSALTHPSPRGG